VPCQPTGVDLHSASETVRLIAQAQSIRSGVPKAVVFLSRAVAIKETSAPIAPNRR
jgi:chromosome partitioning protein